MARTPFKLVNLNESFGSPAPKRPKIIDWTKCFLCQDEKADEGLQNPNNITHRVTEDAYTSLARNLEVFQQLKCLPKAVDLISLRGDSGLNLEKNLRLQHAVFHRSCSLKFNGTMLRRAEKRASIDKENSCAGLVTTRSSLTLSSSYHEDKCIFCEACGTRTHPLSLCATEQGAKQILEVAAALGNDKILLLHASKRLKDYAKYHPKCRTEFVNRRRPRSGEVRREDKQQADELVLAGLASFMREERDASDGPIVWKMADVARTYASEMKALESTFDAHSTRLRERLLGMCPELESSGTAGQDIMLVYKRDVNTSIREDCRREFDHEAHHLSRAAEIVRADLFDKDSLLSLKALVRMVIRSCGQPHSGTDDDRFVDTIAELMAFHATKRGGRGKHRRHNKERETPTPVYVATKVFGETRKKELVGVSHSLGLSISYDRLTNILEEKAAASAALYRRQNIVCPESLKMNVFTTVSVDNIDHNTSSSTAMGSFHGTAICVSQHPTPNVPGVPQVIEPSTASPGLPQSNRFDLPDSYATVRVSFLDSKKANLPLIPSSAPLPEAGNAVDAYRGEREWLRSCRSEETCVRWAVFHSKKDQHRPPGKEYKTHTVALPLFHEKANTISMMAHTMQIAASTTEYLNPGQTPALVGDQPLFALLKSIQWLDRAYSEEKVFVMMGGLHIEMTAMRICGQWMGGSGWEEMLVEAGIAEQGSAEAMVHDSNHNKTRHSHQVTAATLHILLEEAYEDYASGCDDPPSFDTWRTEMRQRSAQFRFWDISLNLELVAMELSRSMRLGDFSLYKSALAKLAPWCFSLDHPNYARWLPIHMRDLENLPLMHPDLYERFQAGQFVGRLSEREGSGVPWDHLHEDKNRDLKGDGGMIGLTEQRGKLRKWSLITPHLAEMNMEFEGREESRRNLDTQHHQASEKKRQAFQTQVAALTEAFRSAVNPFSDDSHDLYNLHSGTICSDKVRDTVFRVEELGRTQFNTFAVERVNSNAVSLHAPIRQNKLPLFCTKTALPPKVKAQVKSLKDNCKLFGALFVSASDGNRPVEKTDFFSHEMEEYPPSLSLHGAMRSTNKADLLRCLMEGIEPDCNNFGPAVDAKVLDGAAIVHMVLPGGCRFFADYSKEFLSFLLRQAENVKRVDVVWDRYDKDSLKNWTRLKRGEGVRRRVTPTTKVPVKGWKNFLRNSENKQELFLLLSEGVRAGTVDGKVLCSTHGEGVVFAQDTTGLELRGSEEEGAAVVVRAANAAELGPCNHEEADTRIMVHVANAAQFGHRRILILTVDTDVLVIAVSSFHKFTETDELWVFIKGSKPTSFYPVHEIVATLGPSKSLAMIGFHAFTGCDNVSSFFGIGKTKAWAALKAYPEAVNAFIALSEGNIDAARQTLMNFVIYLYSTSETYPSLAMCRRALHTKDDRPVDSLPPTEDTLDCHIQRASLQAQTWRQSLAPVQDLPSPADWGWRRDDAGNWTPVWKTTPVAAKAFPSLVRCKCKVACKGNCGCKKKGNKHCGERCKCNCESAKLK